MVFRPGLIAPVLAAQTAATFQRLSSGRLLLNIVSGDSDAEQRGYGDRLGHDERYVRAGEFLDIVRTAWTGEPFDKQGVFLGVEGAHLRELAGPAAPGLLRRLLRGCDPGRGPARRHLSDVG